MSEQTSYETIRYERPADRVARIVLNRPDRANAQNNQLLYELNDAFDRAAKDDDIRVIILTGEGRFFSSGHDLSPGEFDPTLTAVDTVSTWGGFDQPGIEGYWAFEEEAYFGLCQRWRNIPKPTIAAVKGKVMAAGLMLAWVCDLIIASEETTFQDPVVAFGANGVEYFGHPWELGPRKAKEMLFTGRGITANAAKQLGMVNQIVSFDRLDDHALELASEIAQQPMMGLKLAKQAVNQAQDAQGMQNALRAAMNLQALGHAHNMKLYDDVGNPEGYPLMKELGKKPPLE